MSIAIIIVFIIGYAFIALESVTKINKAAIALLMFVICWTLYVFDPTAGGLIGDDAVHTICEQIESHLGETSTTLFFLLGAMTIVELVDQNGGFNFVKEWLKTKSKRSLLWRIAFLTFALSAILDNLTTSIVMIMILRKLVKEKHDRWIYASIVVIAANSGGAFSPIGDVTTIMLWNKGVLTAWGIIKEMFIPSVISLLVPAFILSRSLHGTLETPETKSNAEDDNQPGSLSSKQRVAIFYLGVGGLIFVPIFKTVTHLPPFVGILLVLGILWTITETMYSKYDENDPNGMQKRVSKMLTRIDMPTIMFFLGILMAVGCLQSIGVLTTFGEELNSCTNGNHYLVTGIIGVLSSIMDNVPLVAGCMNMYPAQPIGDFSVDGIFWQLLAYCAGVGGSILIIGSAAGVVIMGLEKMTFGWYMRKISWVAFLGYLAGIIYYWLEQTVIMAR
jgi:Na+/H+ antiporter NhaD/arsenite permease-like protein